MLGHILMTAVNAVLPIVLLILLGYWLKQRKFLTDSFLKTGNALVFNVCLPCMLFINVYDIQTMSGIPWGTVIYSLCAIVVLFLVGLGIAVVSTKDLNRRGVLWQCVFRSNYAIIGLPLTAALGGEAAVSVSAIVAALAIPLFNTFAVIALSVFKQDAKGKKASVGSVLLGVVKNPLIIGVVLGLGCLGIRALQVHFFGEVVFALNRELKFLHSVIEKLNALTTPLALVVLGGQFKFSVVGGMLKEITIGTVSRIVLSPVLCIGGAVLLSKTTGWFDCGPDTVPALLCLFGTPVAVSSAVMASQMDGDEQLATQLVVWTSIGSVFTTFALVCVLMAAGLLAV